MNQYIIFAGKDSRNIGPDGLIIEQMPDEMKPSRNIEEYQMPGRDGRIIEDLGGYDAFSTNIKINCNGASISDVYAWLDGEGWMITSDSPEFMRYVGFYGQIRDQRFRTDACYDTITVPVQIQPYKYKVQQDPIVFMQADVFPGEGNREAKPVIEITGSGDVNLMLNGYSVLIDDLDGTIILDCDTETPYIEADGAKAFAGRKVTVIDNEWPKLEPTMNSINWSGDITQVTLHPWWRWI